jgi:hypothetical protein
LFRTVMLLSELARGRARAALAAASAIGWEDSGFKTVFKCVFKCERIHTNTNEKL